MQLSTGNVCRKHIAEGTPFGKEIDFLIKSGKLISDKLILDIVSEWLTSHQDSVNSIILDGFPRTVAQAHMLDELLKKKFTLFRVYIIRMNVSDERLIARVVGRYVCENNDCQAVYSLVSPKLAPSRPMICDECSSKLKKRADDTAETMKTRLLTYHQHERELLDFYKKNGQAIHELNGELTLEETFAQLKAILAKT